jgi:predicted AAA+ superfamily ATPase
MFGKVQAARRSARAIMLGSAPSSSNKLAQGLELNHVLLGVVQPEQSLGVYKDALRALQDKLSYLSVANNRFWFDTRPNLRREMEERKRRFEDREHVTPEIQSRIHKAFASGIFTVHPFNDSKDVMDDWGLKLVVLPPPAAYTKSGQNPALERALEILKNRGDQPRQKQNRLLFLAPDYDNVSRLKEMARTWLAWRSIVNETKTLNLDQHQATQAQDSLTQAEKALKQMVRETFKWLLAPVQEVRQGKVQNEISWEAFTVNAGATNLTQEVERILAENELVISKWAPVHLHRMLTSWFWKDGASDVLAMDVWQKSCCYLFLPRLKDDQVLSSAIAAGVESKEFFAFAQAKENSKYSGFVFGKRTSPYVDTSSVLIEPTAAAAYEEMAAQIASATDEQTSPSQDESDSSSQPETTQPAVGSGETTTLPAKKTAKRFYGSVDLDANQALPSFISLFNEVITLFNDKGVKPRITIDIEAENLEGFDDGLQRAIRENCSVLKFKSSELDE